MKIKNALIAASFLFVAQGALAVPYFESPDAPPLLPGQALPSGTDQIFGALATPPGNTPIYVDIFSFAWGGGVLTIDSFGSSFDTQLFLFDALGLGVVANDDTPGGPPYHSELTAMNLSGGTYYLGISAYNNDPLDGANNPIFTGCSFTAQCAGSGGALASWTGSAFSGGEYVINFSEAVSVPEPGTLALLGLGLIGMAARRRKTA